ncbi:MAG: hypothetical protein V1872_02210 [bacterium]
MEDLLDELVENERMYYVYKNYQRRLKRYRGINNSFKEKYKLAFDNFEKEIIARIEECNFEVNCDAREWRDAVNQIKMLEERERLLMDYIFWTLRIKRGNPFETSP